MKNETKPEKEIEKTEADEDTKKGDKPEAATIVERAEQAAERMEKANEERKNILKREEENLAKQALGGKSRGPSEESKKPMTDKEFKDYIVKHGKPPEE